MLVALRLWESRWTDRAAIVTLKSDNFSALAMASRLKATGRSNIVAREVALLYSEASYEPKFVEHLPGLANVGADALSRLCDPSGKFQLPRELAGIAPTPVPPRTESYYRALAASQVGSRSKRRRR